MAETTVEVTVSPGLTAPSDASDGSSAQTNPQDLLLVVFIHG